MLAFRPPSNAESAAAITPTGTTIDTTSSAPSAIPTLFWGRSGDFWDTCLILSVVVAAVAAGAIGVSTIGSIAAHKREASAAKQALDRYKAETAGKVADATRTGIEAGEKAGHAQADVDAAQVEIANANARTAQAKLETEQIRRDFANRRITESQHEILVKLLSQHKGTINFDVMSDTESGLYAADLLKTFTDAGWTIGEKTFPLGEIWTGLSIENNETAETTVVVQAFRAAGVPFGVSHRGRPSVTLMVGGKPPVF